MLSAAYDILAEQESPEPQPMQNVTTSVPDTTTVLPPHTRKCNQLSTGAILLADILPSLIVKMTAALWVHRVTHRIRVPIAILFATASFIIVACSVGIWMSLLGVACASFSSGLGELTFLGLTAFYHKNTVSSWSSGTGGAGLFGALSYAGLTATGLSPQHSILVMLVVPAVMTLSYYVILDHVTSPPSPCCVKAGDTTPLIEQPPNTSPEDDEDCVAEHEEGAVQAGKVHVKLMCLQERLKLILPLLKYMVPLFGVYVAEYYINQALFELIYFEHIWLTLAEQYRWYQVDYQMGVFISRSSVNVYHTKRIWVFPLLQVANAVFFTVEAYFLFVPHISIILIVVLFEGLMGGGAYVNCFYAIREEVAPEVREFSLAVASVSDSTGTCLAGFLSIPVHNYICSLPIPG
ncbi:PREDICTED: battenin-like [Priapulus caudatus]|uniref:Battenin n=1 Tax=Priapulus caudatus TaxID=37621 RepID=A0ABM1DNC3_PRICU|nr:PREDICTED: battenin-like [Priapulus caudatus]